jgi:diaminohydroxyphosphoribosylaminopyrimidine deaminase / 5-amino-6-(5-phosphoribosylamino)uracil reductase
VTVNVAMSLDGRIACAGGRRWVFSDAQDKKRVHGLRAEHDAILVGVGTVIKDDPVLRVDPGLVPAARDPLRVVLDSGCRMPADARVLDGTVSTRVYHCSESPPVDREAVRWVRVPSGPDQGVDLAAVLLDLQHEGVGRLMVEGGSRVIASFVEVGAMDEMLVFVAPVFVGEGAPGLLGRPAGDAGIPSGLRVVDSKVQGSGVLMRLEATSS